MQQSEDARTRAALLLQSEEVSASEDEIFSLVYEELRRMAHLQLGQEPSGHTLRTTALVHEAYLRLVDGSKATDRGRSYFFGAAARAMRQVLVDHARRRRARKRGGGRLDLTLDEATLAVDELAHELIDLDRALEELASLNPRHARVVECRFFAGMDVPGTAAALRVSERTVKADWAFARAWLKSALKGSDDPEVTG